MNATPDPVSKPGLVYLADLGKELGYTDPGRIYRTVKRLGIEAQRYQGRLAVSEQDAGSIREYKQNGRKKVLQIARAPEKEDIVTGKFVLYVHKGGYYMDAPGFAALIENARKAGLASNDQDAKSKISYLFDDGELFFTMPSVGNVLSKLGLRDIGFPLQNMSE